jgi:hypothetical protein
MPGTVRLPEDEERIIMRTAKEIRNEIRQLKKEMRERGIKVMSFLNRQPSLEAARANERLFALKAELRKATCG